MSQKSKVRVHLQLGKTLTPLEALDKFGCLRLGAIIFDLRAEGHQIETDMITVGHQKQVARYRYITGELFK